MVNGAVCLVTGGTSGLGLATVRKLLANNAKVVYLGRSDRGLSDLESKANAAFIKCDITQEAEVKSAVDTTIDKFGRLDAVVNSAGIRNVERVFNVKKGKVHKEKSFMDVMATNVWGTFNVNRFAAEAMFKHTPVDEDGLRGVLINVSSGAGFEGQIGQTAYATSKGAIHGMTITMARDMTDIGVRVNTISPGLMLTEEVRPLLESPLAGQLIADCPSRRLGELDEFAELVEHVIDNKYLNGAIIRVDGGLRLRP